MIYVDVPNGSLTNTQRAAYIAQLRDAITHATPLSQDGEGLLRLCSGLLWLFENPPTGLNINL